MQYLSIHNYSEIFSFFIAIITLKKTRSSFMGMFVWYLGIISAVEIFVLYQYHHHVKVMPYNNVLNLFCSLFYAFIFTNLVNPKQRKIIIRVAIIYVCYWLYEMIVGKKFHQFYAPVFFSSWLLTIFFCLWYFAFYLKQENIENENNFEAGFILVAGIFLYCIGSAIIIVFAKQIWFRHLTVLNMPLQQFVIRLLCIPLYGSISFALLKWKQIPTTSTQ